MLGNGHGSGPSLVELGMALERPASGVNSGSAQKAAAAAAGQGPQTGTQKSPKSAGVHPLLLPACLRQGVSASAKGRDSGGMHCQHVCGRSTCHLAFRHPKRGLEHTSAALRCAEG